MSSVLGGPPPQTRPRAHPVRTLSRGGRRGAPRRPAPRGLAPVGRREARRPRGSSSTSRRRTSTCATSSTSSGSSTTCASGGSRCWRSSTTCPAPPPGLRGWPSWALTNPCGPWPGSLALHGGMPGGLDQARCIASAAPWPVPHSRPPLRGLLCPAALSVVLLTKGLPAGRAALPVRGTAPRRAGGTSVASPTPAR